MSSAKTPGGAPPLQVHLSSSNLQIFTSSPISRKNSSFNLLPPHTLPTSSNLPLVQSDRSICLSKGKPLLPPHPGLPVQQKREPATPFIKPLASVPASRPLYHSRLTPELSSIHRSWELSMLEALPQFTGIEERFQALETSITENQTALRSVLNDTFNQIMDRLDEMGLQPPNGPGPVPSIPAPTPAQGTNPLGDPNNVLSRLYWVEKSVVQSISEGHFDIHDLPKLHREEEQRMRHSKKVTEGVHFPADGGRPELMTGRTKMHLAFKDLATFLSAWMVYVSIRSTFVPERAPPLAYWTEKGSILCAKQISMACRPELRHCNLPTSRHIKSLPRIHGTALIPTSNSQQTTSPSPTRTRPPPNLALPARNPLFRFKIKLVRTGTAPDSDVTTKNDLATHVPANTGAQSA